MDVGLIKSAFKFSSWAYLYQYFSKQRYTTLSFAAVIEVIPLFVMGQFLASPPAPPAFLTFYISPAISPHTDALGQFSRCHIQVSKIQIPKLMASFLHLTVPVSIMESSKHNRVAFPFQDSTGEHTWEQFVWNLFTKMNRTNANQRSANVQASII